MAYSITCSCGYVLHGRNDEELYSLIRRHIVPLDRERHHPVAVGDAPVRVPIPEAAGMRRTSRPAAAAH